MAKMQVVGKGVYGGEFNGVPYKKLCFVVASEAPKKFEGFDGTYCEQIIAPFTPENNNVKIGDIIQVYYNKYGKVDAVFVVEDK